MNPRTVWIILKKELLDIVRDRRAVLCGLAIPLLLYPFLLLVCGQLTIIRNEKILAEKTRVAVIHDPDAIVQAWLREMPDFGMVESNDPFADLKAGSIEAVISAEENSKEKYDRHETVTLSISFDFTRRASLFGIKSLEKNFEDLDAKILKERVAAAGLAPEFGQPLSISTDSITSPQKFAGPLFGMVIAWLIIIMICLGATYPALDLTVGEKARGTFETLLSTPISKIDIISGKLLTLCTLSLVSVGLNLLSMMANALVFLLMLKNQIPDNALGQILTFSPASMTHILFLFSVPLVPLAVLICAILMSVALLAKDYKDASYFMSPALMLFTWPIVIVLPLELKLNAVTQFVPILNTTLLLGALIAGEATVQSIFVVALINSVLAALALALAVSIFSKEEVVLSEERGIPFSFRRRAELPSRDLPTVGLSLTLFAGAVMLMLYGALPLQSWRMLPGLVITEWVFILGLPLFALWLTKVNWRTALSLYRPSLLSLVGALVLALASIPLIAQVAVWQNHILPFPKELEEQMKALLTSDGTMLSLLFLLFTAALSPAICEEVLFRGAILSGLRTKLNPAVAICITGILFGLIHLMIWRILLTALLGIIIGYVVVRSGSIFPGMLFHFVVNASAVLVTNFAPESTSALLEDTVTQNLPPIILIAATAAAALGIGLIEMSRKDQRAFLSIQSM